MRISGAFVAGGLFQVAAAATGPNWPGFKGLRYFFAFGDSYTAVGFNSWAGVPTDTNPLGVSYPGSTTAGGANWVGYLTTQYNQSKFWSFDYAVSGNEVSGVSNQINEDFLSSQGAGNKPSYAPWTATNTLFSTFIGINDLKSAGEHQLPPRLIGFLPFKKPSIIQGLAISCLLMFHLPTAARLVSNNNATLASLVTSWNTQLKTSAEAFQAKHSDVAVFYYDSWSLYTKLLDNPTQYGFTDVTSTGGSFWIDTIHPRTKVHQYMAEDLAKFLAAQTGSATNPVTTTTTRTTAITTSQISTTTRTTSAPASTATGTVPKWGQCGGAGYTGPTTCVAGTTCTVSNQYYSQPFSAKQRKAQLQEKRAIKRGDLPGPVVDTNIKRTKKKAGGRRPATDSDAAVATANRARMLISSFLKPSPQFLEASKKAASTEILLRPIPESSAILSPGICEVSDQGLTCPRRPKWRYEMTKKEVEKNEEGLFAKWIAQTDEVINTWRQANLVPVQGTTESILPAPTYYERNIEVWRQLWRVCELSSILMILLDARCPPLHYPPSLDAYIKALRPARQVILVLTKIDIVGEECANTWSAWLKNRYGGNGVQVVGVQSYEQVSYGEGQGTRIKYQPHMPTPLRDSLREALKAAHAALLDPPSKVKEDPGRLAKWRPAVRAEVNWEAIGQESDAKPVAVSKVPDEEKLEALDEVDAVPSNDEDDDRFSKEYSEDSFLTVGLIGQPNVGKSSLLNALFGEHKVKASRTPGKTKHFQTLFLTPEIRLVDCPGLVLPALVPMELQVLSNVLPIAQIPALPACIRYVGGIMPIEDIFGVNRSMLEIEEMVEDKRTWREGMRPAAKEDPSQEAHKWTSLQVMNAYATKRGWMTAKAGRPDSMRAGNAMMRSIVEGRVPWAFWPPGSKPPENGQGVWLKGELAHQDEDDVVSSDDEKDDRVSEQDPPSYSDSLVGTDDEEGEDEYEDEEEVATKTTIGRFAALGVTSENEEDEGSE
ncbi:P-loop containing nucleoside triphosphate hydrolase protein, partial [Rhizoctonia solani]